MKEMKRVLSLVLCLMMLVSMIPGTALTAFAAEETIYVLAGGDFQEAGDHANSAENVTNILAQVSKKYQTMDGFLFIGDYDCETHDNATETANGITALMGAVQGSYSNLNDANSVLVQGNHDYMDSRIDATGGHEFEGYAAYVLNEDDYPNYGGSQSGVQTLANNLETWLNNKIGEGYDAPIFVVSHLPLAFTPRTVTQGDAKYAKYIFDVLNDAGDNGLNIIFLHGHDHAYGPDNYMGGEAIYLAEGDKICIAEAGSTSAWTEETLSFTYMNAGYTGYYSDAYTYVTTAGTDKLTMTVFAITGNEVTVERYSEDGLYNMKSAGYDGSYSDTSVTNLSLGLPKYENVYTSPQTIDLTAAEAYGTIGSWVGVTAEVNGDVNTSGNDWTTITEPTNGTTTYAYTQANSITRNGEYVIVANDRAVALWDNNGQFGSRTVTINGSTMTSGVLLTEWTFSNSSSGTVYNGTRYLYFNNGNNNSSRYFSLSQNSSNLTFTDNGSNFRVWFNRSSGSDYSFYYNGSSWTSSTNTQAVRLFVRNEAGDVTTGGTNGLYGKLDGDLTYNVAAGTSAEDALAAVKAGIAVKYATAADYSDEAEFADDGEGLTWTLDPNYDGNVPGDYAVTISYNGTVLGTAEVIVPATTTYYIAEGNGLYTVDMNTSADDALSAVKEGVTLSSATDANGTGKTPVSDDDVTWNWVDKYDGTNYGPYTVEILKDGISLGTVEVKVNVHYDAGIADGWVPAGTTPTTYRYVLDTDGYETGTNNRYLFVASDAAYAMDEDGSGVVPVTFNDDETEAVVDSRDYEWYIYQGRIDGSTRRVITKTGDSSFLYHADYTLHLGTNDNGYWTIDEDRQSEGLYRFYNADGGSTWYLRYHTDGYMGVTTSTERYLRLYKYDGEIEGGDVYAKIEGNTVYTVTQGTSATAALGKVKAGITGYVSGNADGSNATELDDSKLTWTWKNTYASMVTGSYWVEISYQGKVLGTVEVKVEPGVVNNYPEYPNEGAVKVNKTGTGMDFQSSGIAQVEISASGIPTKKGIDVIVMVDTSSSMRTWCICGTQNCESTGSNHQRRNVIFEDSLENLIKQLQSEGADGQPLDIRVALADFNGFNGHNDAGVGTSGTPYDRDENDTTNDTDWYSAANQAKVYTGTGSLDEGAFVAATELSTDSATYGFNYVSGTNYDYAFDAIYQLGHNIKKANAASGQDRDLYVVFMSDGAPMQYNYYHSQGNSTRWQYWLTGTVESNGGFSDVVNCQEHIYYYDEATGNQHRMANAVKGDPAAEYEIIRKATTGLEDVLTATNEENMYNIPGLGATMFSIAFDPAADGNTPASAMTHVLEDIASEATESTRYYYMADSANDLANAFTSIGNAIAYAATNARFVDQMGDDYNLQMAVSNYEVVEGNATVDRNINPKIEILSYDIYTRQDYLDDTITEDKIGDRKGTYTVLETVTFNADGTEAYSDKKSGNILIDGVIHAQTFWYNTTATDVAVEGVSIPTGTKADGTTTGSTNLLPSETFYWKLGTVQTSELAMRYYVYLEGSMEGTRDAGSYPTNEYATLYYDNYLGNPCYKDTVSPVMPWKEANVSYAFYLVNEKGEIIVNQTTGQTGSFANKIAVTNPVVYDTVLLNTDEEIDAVEAAKVLPDGYTLFDATYTDGVITDGAKYTVTINSNTTGGWEIESVKNVDTTYVMHYDPNNAAAYSIEKEVTEVGYDYTHTTVWFAVVWKVQALPDVVVIDYGLPVDISVLTNDMFGDNGKLAGVGAYTDTLNLDGHDATLASGFGTNYTGTYGAAKADNTTGKVRYTLNTMQMNGYEKFAYAVNYTGNENAGYYYDTVTVIPATTIYYEDSFVEFDDLEWVSSGANSWEGAWEVVENPADSVWEREGETVDGVQDEDRPGFYSLTDANNIYGYDSVNNGMSTYSMGSAMKATVDYDHAGQASFTFYGTGFDVISMTDSTTGTILLDVYPVNADGTTGTRVAYMSVDTYYGYTQTDCHVVYTFRGGAWIISDVLHKYTACTADCAVESALPEIGTSGQEVHMIANAWIVDPTSTDGIWQVPVAQVEGLPYGKYKAVIQAVYEPAFDHNSSTATTYDFYLDAIRIYDPANDGASDGSDDTTIEDAYKADGEGWPSYIELRNNLIDAKTLGNTDTDTVVTGLVFIDGDKEVGDAQLSDYVNYGPNNEVYLAPGQRVAFILDAPDNIANIHVGISSANGEPATYTITNIAQFTNSETGVEAGDYYGAKTGSINTTTDMYYDLTGYRNDIIVISNTGDLYNTTGILSLTNIKSTYTSDPNGTVTTADENEMLSVASASAFSLRSTASEASVMSAASAVTAADTTTVENAGFETSIYMTPEAAALTLWSLNNADEEEVPEETEPETTVPEETEPETTIPEETEPETTVPEETEPEATEPGSGSGSTIGTIIGTIIKKLLGWLFG